MEKMAHDDGTCFCLAAALDTRLIARKRLPSPTRTLVSWEGQIVPLCLCLNLGCTPWPMDKMPHGEAAGGGGNRLLSLPCAENVGDSVP